MHFLLADLAKIGFLLLVPAIVISAFALKGRPKSFDRSMYWTCFCALGISGGIIFGAGQRLESTQSDHWLLQGACQYGGLLLMGAGFGCGLSIFLFRGPVWRGTSQQ